MERAYHSARLNPTWSNRDNHIAHAPQEAYRPSCSEIYMNLICENSLPNVWNQLYVVMNE